MNAGAFGENFPYSNFHDLNMDWIIKIAKDFLDQYTHIQEVIANGEQSLQDLTADGLEQLQAKADALEALLQAWYNTHSEDIANQLADALEDLNEWYTTHQNYLDQTLEQNVSLFNQRAEAKASEVLQTIPEDYTEIDQMVKSIQLVASQLFTAGSMFVQSGYIDTAGEERGNANYVRTYFIPVKPMREGIILYDNMWGNNNVVNIISAYDSEKNYISGVVANGQYQTGNYAPPVNAAYVRLTTLKQYITDGQTHIHITPNFTYDEWLMGAMMSPLIEGNRAFQFRGYIQNGTDFYGNDAFVRTGYIPACGGDSFYYTNLIGNADAISVVSIFDINKTPISHIQSTGTYQSGSVTIPQDGYIMFCCNKTYIDNNTTNIRYSGNLSRKFNINLQTRRYVTEGIKLCTVGDSITRQTWTDDKWQNELINNLHLATTFQNLGFDGKTVSTSTGLCSMEILEQIDSQSDLILIMGGVNDWAWNVPIGDRTYDNTDETTFFGACNLMFRRVTGVKTSSRIVAFGTTFARIPNRDTFTDPVGFKNNLGLTTLDYSKAMMESAEINGIEHYNIGGNLCINQGNYQTYYRDSDMYLHPNVIMTAMIASFMTRCLG